MQSSRMLDPVAAAAAIAALEEEGDDNAEDGEEEQGAAEIGEANIRTQGLSPPQPHRNSYLQDPYSQTHARPQPRQPSIKGRRAMFAAARSAKFADGVSADTETLPNGTHMTFEPSSGVLGPGEDLSVRVTVHGLTDGRSRSIVQLRSGAGFGHMECIEAFVCVVTPKCVIDRPVLDLGITFVGVQVRQLLIMRNLSLLPLEFRWSSESADEQDGALAELRVKPEKGQLAPGEEVELQVRYTPRAIGQSVMYGVCELGGAPQPLGFRLISAIHSLDVTYDLLTQEEYEEMGGLETVGSPAAGAIPAPMGVEASGVSSGEASLSGGMYFSRQSTSPLPASFFRRGRKGRLELDVGLLQGSAHLPPEILARIASGAAASTTASGGDVAASRGVSQQRLTFDGPVPRTWPPPTPQRHLVADFGKSVPLGESRQMYLVLTNRTAMHTSIRTWLDRFGVDDASKFMKKRSSSKSDVGGGSTNRQRDASYMSTESEAISLKDTGE
ncbi:hypothetical protein Vafri_7044 [Volvox africanus]|uniref:HYDIN/VesB/CFA65-like Ig-like domain-containing protein n=1 Tax=Volvox africanus TaxID=51714 RepID=A0A8J4AZF2_9CHLO|nr:hypothetical protein Vafri_7044 [Volvox africanus]